jgi:hypothetical protein
MRRLKKLNSGLSVGTKIFFFLRGRPKEEGGSYQGACVRVPYVCESTTYARSVQPKANPDAAGITPTTNTTGTNPPPRTFIARLPPTRALLPAAAGAPTTGAAATTAITTAAAAARGADAGAEFGRDSPRLGNGVVQAAHDDAMLLCPKEKEEGGRKGQGHRLACFVDVGETG